MKYTNDKKYSPQRQHTCRRSIGKRGSRSRLRNPPVHKRLKNSLITEFIYSDSLLNWFPEKKHSPYKFSANFFVKFSKLQINHL